MRRLRFLQTGRVLSFFILAAPVLCLPLTIFGQTTNEPEVIARADEYMVALVKVGWFNGSVLIVRDGKILLNKGYGSANFELDVPNSPQTKFRIGSITKPFTATAIMILRDRGKLSLQDSICKYVSDCPPAWQPITLHHLLSHTSGLAKHEKAGEYLKTAMMPMSLSQLIDSFKNKPADFKPGEKLDYNNNGYILLGYVIEKVSGQSYEAFVKENIFGPLKMLDSGYDNHDPVIKNRASGYRSENGHLFNAAYIDQSQPFAAGALYSTTGDLLLLDQALYGDKLLSQKTLNEMFTPAIGPIGPAPNYGYGWFVNKQLNRRAIFHPGGLPGFGGIITRFPDDKVLIVLLSNFDNAKIIRASNDLAAIVFGEKYAVPKIRTAVKINPKVLEAYAGEYEDRPGRITKILVENGTLKLQLAANAVGQIDPIPMSAESDTQFFDPFNDTQVEFIKEADGRITEMVLRINGRELHAKKIK